MKALLTIILTQRLWGRTHFSLNIELFLFLFLALLLDMQDLNSPTRDQTYGPCSGNTVSTTAREVLLDCFLSNHIFPKQTDAINIKRADVR